jgi:hypothetical protein
MMRKLVVRIDEDGLFSPSMAIFLYISKGRLCCKERNWIFFCDAVDKTPWHILHTLKDSKV